MENEFVEIVEPMEAVEAASPASSSMEESFVAVEKLETTTDVDSEVMDNENMNDSMSDSSFGLASLLFTSYSSKTNSVHENEDANSARASLLSSRSSTRRSSVTETEFDLTHTALTGLDSLLNRLASERLLELRRIQDGDRPVTGSEARATLDSFFQRAMGEGPENERIEEEEANRPQQINDDVTTLLQQSIVQNALQTGGFRSQLERTLGSRSFSFQPRPRPSSTRSLRSTSRHPVVNNRPLTIQEEGARDAPNGSSIPAPPPIPGSPTTSDSISDSAPSSVVRRLELSVEDSMQLLAETITEDLGRLQSLHLVSDMMRTDFRGRLEQMINERVQTVGNGEQVRETIRQLPPSSHRRTAPVQGPSIANRRSSQSQAILNDNLSREVDSLRHQVEDMKRMLSVSLEMQMDVQRAVRQEVAGVFHAFMQEYLLPKQQAQQQTQPAEEWTWVSSVQESTDDNTRPITSATAAHVTSNRPATRGACVICCERGADTVLYQCGHMCVCIQCGLQLKQDGHNCPMCRAPIRDVIRAYTQE